MKKAKILLLLASCSLLVTACNTKKTSESGGEGEESSSIVTENVEVEGVSISGNGNGVAKGSSIDLMADITPANATNKNVTWSSDNPEVASVDQTGRVTGVEFGRTIIRVRTEDGGFTSTYKVVVTKNGTKVVSLADLIVTAMIIILPKVLKQNQISCLCPVFHRSHEEHPDSYSNQ